jgi:hypothetical protein
MGRLKSGWTSPGLRMVLVMERQAAICITDELRLRGCAVDVELPLSNITQILQRPGGTRQTFHSSKADRLQN